MREFDTALDPTKSKTPVNEEFTKSGRSFCDELKNNVDLKEVKEKPEFNVTLEKYGITCTDLVKRR